MAEATAAAAPAALGTLAAPRLATPGAGTEVRPRRRPPTVLIAGAAVALIVAVGVIAVVASGTGGKPSPQTNASGSATPTSAAGTCAFLKPGAAVAAGLGSSSCALLGPSLAGGQIAGQPTLPGDLKSFGVDAAGKIASPPPALTIGVGGAQLSASPRGYQVGVTAPAVSAANVIVVADFTASADQDADIGIGVQCTQQSCLRLSVSPKTSKFTFDEVSAGSAAPKPLQSGDAPFTPGVANRLVVEIQGTRMKAWLNGSLLAIVNIDVNPQPGPVEFFNTDQSTAGPSAVSLASFYALAPG